MIRVIVDGLASPSSLERGTVADPPWGVTLAAIGIAGRTGELTVRDAGGKRFTIAFTHGVVVGATSPLAADTVARIAQSEHLVTSSRISELARHRRSTRRDELEGFVDDAGLAPAQIQHLKRRVLLQRARRTFSIGDGTFELQDRISIPVVLGAGVDVRAIVYLGARLELDDDRLATDLRRFGARFKLIADSVELARFELSDAERPIVDALREGASLPEIEARHRDLDPRMAQAVVYALVSCGAVAPVDAGMLTATASPTLSRVPTPHEPTVTRAPTPREPTMTRVPTPREPTMSCVPMIIRNDPEIAFARAPTPRRRPTISPTEPFIEVRPTTVRPNALGVNEVRALIVERSVLFERGVDHFTLLGVPIGASVAAVREAYLELARYLRPERLAGFGFRDRGFRARSLFAQICIAHTVLSDPARRAEYMTELRQRGASLDFGKLAEEAFVRGESALRANEPELAVAELRTACELDPDDVEYIAQLARAERAVSAKRSRDR